MVNQGTSGSSAVRGAFGFNTKIKLSGIKDWTSNTAALSERQYWRDGNVNDITAIGNFGGDPVAPTDCSGLFVNGSFSALAPYQFGDRWADSEQWRNGVTLNGPPNSPACVGNNDQNSMFVRPPSSAHSGGVNVAMLDGTVRFVADGIDAGNQSAKANTSGGLSPFGVWGAMGTRNGGESVSIP